MELGIEVFIREKQRKVLEKQKVAFLGHSVSVAQDLKSSLSLIFTHTPLKISCIISPQHGFHGVEQANMIPTEDEPAHLVELNRQVVDATAFSDCDYVPSLKSPIFSLYSAKNRRLTKKMQDHFDVLIVDLQDVGCRVYTYLTTLLYILEDLSHTEKKCGYWIDPTLQAEK